MTKDLTYPVVHSNGSGEEYLKSQYTSLFHRVYDAKQCLEYIDFHRRDYYPLGEEAYQKALSEREKAVECLKTAYQYARSIKYALDKD